MSNGIMTTNIARALRHELAQRSLDVLYSHGQNSIDPASSLGKIRAWYGTSYTASTILADLDIAIVEPKTDRLLAVIEIEETTSKPKVLLGDALAMLLGSHITFQDKRHLRVGPWTTLIVLASTNIPESIGRIAFLEAQVNQLRADMLTPNAAVGHVVIDSFPNEEWLGVTLRKHIEVALSARIMNRRP